MFQITIISNKGYTTDIGDFVDNFLYDEEACIKAATLIETSSPLIFVQDLEDLQAFGLEDLRQELATDLLSESKAKTMTNIPTDIEASLKRYVEDGCPTGGFLHAVLSNDLMLAMEKADDFNRHRLFDICNYIYNNIPYTCYGSPEIVKNWLESKRLERQSIVEKERQ